MPKSKKMKKSEKKRRKKNGNYGRQMKTNKSKKRSNRIKIKPPANLLFRKTNLQRSRKIPKKRKTQRHKKSTIN